MQLHKSNNIVEQCNSAILLRAKEKNEEDKFIPCPRIISNGTCNTYEWPATKWYQGECPFSKRSVAVEDTKKINPLKASKRSKKGTG